LQGLTEVAAGAVLGAGTELGGGAGQRVPATGGAHSLRPHATTQL